MHIGRCFSFVIVLFGFLFGSLTANLAASKSALADASAAKSLSAVSTVSETKFANAANSPGASNRILACMKKELQRNFEALKKANPPAYFIAYRLYDADSFQVSASRGLLISGNSRMRAASVQVEVRVGSRALDNFHPLKEGVGSDSTYSLTSLWNSVPFEGDPDGKVLRAKLCLATEDAYRKAEHRYGQVLAKRGLAIEKDSPQDFTRESPVIENDGVAATMPLDSQTLTDECKLLSQVFSEYKDIKDSYTSIRIEQTRRYLVTSEGTDLADAKSRTNFYAIASALTQDAETVSRTETLGWCDQTGPIREKAKLKALVKEVASSVCALRKAPVAEPYCGPVMLNGCAAGVLFHEVLGHRLEASRYRNAEEGRTFSKMLNQKILPPFISVYDRPLQKSVNGCPLTGSYKSDDEGVKAQNVTLVNHGRLVDFLLSREPVLKFTQSNGHGRCDGSEERYPASRMANLIVESSRAVPDTELRDRLISAAKKQGKPYGLLIEAVESGETNTSSYEPQMFQVCPSVVKRVFTNGKPDQLVRGVRLIGTPLAALQHIVETGDKTAVFNGFCGAESGWIPQADCCPSILVEKSGRYTEAEPLYKRSLEIIEKKLGADRTDQQWSSLPRLSSVSFSDFIVMLSGAAGGGTDLSPGTI